jgi:hypothetical protein
MYSASGFDSSAFNAALLAPIREVKMRVTALDGTTLLPLEEITGATVEGTVYVDSDRSTRRTCQLRVIDRNGEYTPKGSNYTSYGKNALFYWDKLLKVEYGVKVGSSFVYVPLGIFMIDRVEVVAERGAAVINVDGIDLWKKFTFSDFSAPQNWASGTPIKTIVTAFATGAGISSTRINLSALDSKTNNTTTVLTAVEMGDNRGDKLLEFAEKWSIDLYFDRNGFLVAKDKAAYPYNGAGGAANFEFSAGTSAIMLGIVKSQSGDTIKNHIVVVGEDPEGRSIVRAEAFDATGTTTSSKYYTNSNSATSVESIGDRVLIIRMVTASLSRCLERAKTELVKNVLVEEEIRLPAIVNPLFDEFDVISIIEANSGVNDSYMLRAFDVPMQGSRQELVVRKSRSIY